MINDAWVFLSSWGGFHLFERSSQDRKKDDRGISQDDEPLHPLLVSDLVQFDGYSESFFMPTEAETKDGGGATGSLSPLSFSKPRGS